MSKPTLYAVTLEAKEIDGELAIALDLIDSDDDAERQQGEELVEALLSRAASNSQALSAKADSICGIYEQLMAKAEYLKEVARARAEQAKRQERSATSLLGYLTRCLTLVNPGQKSFSFAEHELEGRSSEAVSILTEEDGTAAAVPLDYCRHTFTIKMPSGSTPEQVDAMTNSIQEFVTDFLPAGSTLKIAAEEDKTAIKAALKATPGSVSGAVLQKNINWKVL
jgi:hypothetical protein